MNQSNWKFFNNNSIEIYNNISQNGQFVNNLVKYEINSSYNTNFYLCEYLFLSEKNHQFQIKNSSINNHSVFITNVNIYEDVYETHDIIDYYIDKSDYKLKYFISFKNDDNGNISDIINNIYVTYRGELIQFNDYVSTSNNYFALGTFIIYNNLNLYFYFI